jgi:pyruvate dehydrogenase E2 component (dihydrolipoamide acetyltransferase)
MAEIIKMPRLSDTMEEGVIVGWQKKVGDKVEPGDILAEVETDKATMELESYHDGYLLHIGVKSGPVPVDGVIAVIGSKDEDFAAQLEAATKGSNGKDADKPKEEKAQQEPKTEPTEEKKPAETTDAENGEDRIKASPLAKSMAKESGIDLSKIKGSGEQGRIIRKDVEKVMESGSTSQAPAQESGTSAGFGAQGYEEVPVSQMRKTIARRLGESKFTAPHFYLTIEIDMDRAIEARKSINESSDTKISFNDLVVKAVAVALKKHPAVNSSWLGDKIRYNKDIHIGVAVAVEDGLLVPVIRFANFKGLAEINAEVKSLAEKAKSKKLTPEEMQGNTFTISNLGMFGIEEFTAIINPPDSCILAVGGIIQKPVVKNGDIVVGNTMKVTLSCDHRSVDGATGAQFLQTFKAILEEPVKMIV